MAIDGEYDPAELYGVYYAEDVDLETFAIFTTLAKKKPIKLTWINVQLLSWSSWDSSLLRVFMQFFYAN